MAADDLYPSGFTGTIGVFALVTIDEQDDGWHICFTQDSGPESRSVTNAIERLATSIYSEACTHALQEGPEAGRFFRRFTRRGIRHKPAAPEPDRFHFCQHIPAEGY